MPGPGSKLKNSYGERRRIAEKEKYKAIADSDHLRGLLEVLKNVPREWRDGSPISHQARECLMDLQTYLPRLNDGWKEYVRIYSDSSLNVQEGMEESRIGGAFFKCLDNCMKSIHELKEDPVYLEDNFSRIRAALANIHGHYQEMQHGELDMEQFSAEFREQANKTLPDPEFFSPEIEDLMVKTTGKYEKDTFSIRPVYYDRSDEPLFPHEPCPDDIYQGENADCYLLATFSAICASNPQIIRKMMKDNGQTVTVSVWDVDEKGEPTEKPSFVTVRKTVPAIRTMVGDEDPRVEILFPHGKVSLWVQMMEKAYAASGMHRKENAPAKTSGKDGQESAAHYRDIEWGNTARTMSRFLGRFARTTSFFRMMGKNDGFPNKDLSDPDQIFQQVQSALEHGHILVASTGDERLSEDLQEKYWRKSIEEIRKSGKGGKVVSPLRERKIRRRVADEVFHGLSLSIDEDGVPSMANHAYAVTGAYEKDGEKYIVVRNPYGTGGEDPDASGGRHRRMGGYSAIPAKEFRGLFENLVCSEPEKSMLLKGPEENVIDLTEHCFRAVQGTLSQWERTFGRWAMSQEFRDLYRALKDARNQCLPENHPSSYSLSQAYTKLNEMADKYLAAKEKNAERDDTRNIRITVARTCKALAESFRLRDDPKGLRDVQRKAVLRMAADCVNFCVTDQMREYRSLTVPADGGRNVEFRKNLMAVSQEDLLKILSSSRPEEIPAAVEAAARKAGAAEQDHGQPENRRQPEAAHRDESVGLLPGMPTM